MPRKGTIPIVEISVKVEGRHPHFPRGMVRKPNTQIAAGSVVMVKAKDGKHLGQAFYNPRATMALRMLTWRKNEHVDLDFLCHRLEDAIHLRQRILRLDKITDSYRLVHGDGDGLPGLVVDKFGRILVLELRTLGMQHFADGLGKKLRRMIPNDGMILTVNDSARKREGLEFPPPPPSNLEVSIRESKAKFLVRPGQGHKTGFFCDQRENRLEINRLARGRHVLDLCCYSGGFSVQAALGGARSVTGVDLDQDVIGQARRNVRHNNLKVKLHHADVFDFLKEMASGGKTWDLVIVDPPAFARSKDNRLEGLKKYRDLNQLAMQVIAPQGIMLTCSCSGPVNPGDFQRVVSESTGRFTGLVRVLREGGAPPDHPLHLHCPETRYLKTMWLQKNG